MKIKNNRQLLKSFMFLLIAFPGILGAVTIDVQVSVSTDDAQKRGDGLLMPPTYQNVTSTPAPAVSLKG